MSTHLTIRSHGKNHDLKGRTVDSIIRRVYGQKASFHPSKDHNSPEAGLAVIWNPAAGAYNILGTVLHYDGNSGLVERMVRDYNRGGWRVTK